MQSPAQDVQAILHAMLEKIERLRAGVDFLSGEVNRLAPKSLANKMDAVSLISKQNEQEYDAIRKLIGALK